MRTHHEALSARFYRGDPGIDNFVLTAAKWSVTEQRYQEIWSFPCKQLNILVHLLTPWSRVFLEKLTGSAASQEIPRI